MGDRRTCAAAIVVIVLGACSSADSAPNASEVAAGRGDPAPTTVATAPTTATSTESEQQSSTTIEVAPAPTTDATSTPVAEAQTFVAVSEVSVAYAVDGAALPLPTSWPDAASGEQVDAEAAGLADLSTMVERLHGQLYGWAGPAAVAASDNGAAVTATLTISSIEPVVLGVVDGLAEPGYEITLDDGLSYLVSAAPTG